MKGGLTVRSTLTRYRPWQTKHETPTLFRDPRVGYSPGLGYIPLLVQGGVRGVVNKRDRSRLDEGRQLGEALHVVVVQHRGQGHVLGQDPDAQLVLEGQASGRHVERELRMEGWIGYRRAAERASRVRLNVSHGPNFGLTWRTLTPPA